MQLDDSSKMISYLASIASESDNLTFKPGEFIPSIEDEKRFIQSHLENENCFALVAIKDDRIIGNLSFKGGNTIRLKHTGEFGVSVLKEYWGNGVATELIKGLLEWAKKSPITKINLKVKEDNSTAISIYKNFDFEIEGKIRRDFCINGKYYDSIIMGKIIE